MTTHKREARELKYDNWGPEGIGPDILISHVINQQPLIDKPCIPK